jgi:SM-20-related protein
MTDNTHAALIGAGIDQLGEVGYCVCVGLLPPGLIAGLIAEQRLREDNGDLIGAGLGRGDTQALGGLQRQVQSSWFDGQSAAELAFLAFADDLRLTINARLMLGLFEFEAQFLHYPPGGFYRRHVDAMQGARNRMVSLVAYLNVDWHTEDGGTLAIWAEGGEGCPVVEVAPLAGTVVLMLSETIPHEARPAGRDRRAIAGWFSVNSSSAGRANPAR